MLRTVRELQGCSIQATDGAIGRIDELLFDDEKWVIRYLVVDTGKWLPGRRVLLSPISVSRTDWASQVVELRLTRERIRNSPDIYSDKPVSRQQEATLHGYYGYGPYWGGAGLWGPAIFPGALAGTGSTVPPPGDPEIAMPKSPRGQRHDSEGDPHLRSTKEVIGYHVQATDDEIGHVDDFIIEDESWAIRYLVVDTSNWPGGRSVLLSPAWVRQVEWGLSKVHVSVTAQRVRSSRDYQSADILRRLDSAASDRAGSAPPNDSA